MVYFDVRDEGMAFLEAHGEDPYRVSAVEWGTRVAPERVSAFGVELDPVFRPRLVLDHPIECPGPQSL